MFSAKTLYRWTQLDETTLPEFRDRIIYSEQQGIDHSARTYPGYPSYPLPKNRSRYWPSLDRTLKQRRSIRTLSEQLPDKQTLSHLLQHAHGIVAAANRGPTPSPGGLQSLELYLVIFANSWLNAGLYHYDRVGHHLAQIAKTAERSIWQQHIPSMEQFSGAALLFVLVGDSDRVSSKYGSRGFRFLLLEAGHLMQNLCLLSTSMGLCTLPLGGFFEPFISQELTLTKSDFVLYLGACGTITATAGESDGEAY